MYNNELEVSTISLSDIYLDPNNPRFWTEDKHPHVKDKDIVEDKIQAQTRLNLEKFGIEELYYSILRNGFLNLDRVVVRPIQEHGDKYVVVEGNRRLAALKKLKENIVGNLISEEHIDEKYLNQLLDSIDSIEILIYKGTEGVEISWVLQGIRHISGIRNWDPAQRGRLVVQQIDDKSKSFKEVGQMLGISARQVGRLYRSYRGLMQMKEDEDFGPKVKNEYFSIFEEAYKNQKVRTWLEWNDNERKYLSEDNLKQFYSWIVPDEDAEQKRRIHDPKHVSYLAVLLERDRMDLIGKVDRHEEGIEEAKILAEQVTFPPFLYHSK